jgi:hypothetical protein
LHYTGGAAAALCDHQWRQLARLPIDAATARIGNGTHEVKVSCALRKGQLKIELYTLSAATRLRATVGDSAAPTGE